VVQVGDERLELELTGDAVVVDGEATSARLTDVPGTPVRLVTVGDAVHRVVARRHPERGRYTLWVDGFRYEVEALDERTRAIRDLSAASGAPAGPAPLLAPMPGLVVRVAVAEGDEVVAGQGLVVMEAMKMENELRAPAAGRVTRVLAVPGSAVEKGALLVELA
jgi:pyruvate carboxylase subunit B